MYWKDVTKDKPTYHLISNEIYSVMGTIQEDIENKQWNFQIRLPLNLAVDIRDNVVNGFVSEKQYAQLIVESVTKQVFPNV